jgi:hypothetical protein|tara:strand:+ start:9665 stop:9838 length:174 start_codon:yes stop_codon:yes gene_type:complete
MANEIYNVTWWGRGAVNNTIGWGDMYAEYVDPTDNFEILTEDGNYVITEAGEYVITE